MAERKNRDVAEARQTRLLSPWSLSSDLTSHHGFLFNLELSPFRAVFHNFCTFCLSSLNLDQPALAQGCTHQRLLVPIQSLLGNNGGPKTCTCHSAGSDCNPVLKLVRIPVHSYFLAGCDDL